MKPVLIKTFGCKVNYAESTEYSASLRAQGIAALDYHHSGTPGAVVLVNTCCVTTEAGRKALQFVRKLRREQPDVPVAATGCGARLPELRARLDAAGAVTFDTFQELTEWLNEHADREGDRGDGCTGTAESVQEQRTRAFIKVQDGCGCRCSYCIIPQVRIQSSRPDWELLDLVDRAVASGHRELVLTGVNLGSYDREQPLVEARTARAAPLITLVQQVLTRLPAGVRLRLSSIEPQDVDVALLELFSHPQLCPHLHIPLQSGSDSVLRAMRRRYTAAQYLRAVDNFRQRVPDGAVTTDILVGFPKETRENFAATLKLCHAARFERVHGFPFSPRPGTPAANLPPLSPGTVSTRNRELLAVCAGIADTAWSRFVGTTCPVLVEEPTSDGVLGHGPAYQIVLLPEGEPGTVVDATLTSYSSGQFHGSPN